VLSSSSLMTAILTVSGVISAAVIAAFGSIIVSSHSPRVAHLAAEHDRIEKLEARQDALETRLDRRDDYIEELREHIRPAPPPYLWLAPFDD